MNKTVIYTAIYGSKDELVEPTLIPAGCDFVCFTDENLTSPAWKIRKVMGTSDDPVRSAKAFKILPHRFFPEYEYSVWVDGNILVRGDINMLIGTYLADAGIAFYDHAKTKEDPRDSVYEEAAALLKRARQGKPKDDSMLIEYQMARYRAERFPDDGGLIVGMEIVRRHNAPDVVRAMEAWWKEIKDGSRRDQLSFNYVAWRQGLKFAYMDGDSRNNPYFLWRPHHN